MFDRQIYSHSGLSVAVLCVSALLWSGSILADDTVLQTRSFPAPDTVSAEAQAFLNQPIDRDARLTPPPNDAAWKAFRAARDGESGAYAKTIAASMPVSVTLTELAGVTVRIVRPNEQPDTKASKVLINLHGGGYVLGGGSTTLLGALPFAMAGYTVVAVDYRMPPDHPYPAAVDDAVAVYEALLETHKAEDMAIYGTSAGGGLSAAAVLAIRDKGLAMPAAVLLNTPWSDLTKTGDTYYTLDGLDPVLVTNDGTLEAMARLYAGAEDLKHPYLSPVYADYSKGFPPTFLLTGTRDLFLSNTVRHHRALRDAGIEADLHVFEGMWHAFTGVPAGLPEAKPALQEMIGFFDRHLLDEE